jgi:crotonobetainyl-CoA:carnitine CoA-transferase CaiB-like acyl-CoA transferase
MRATAIEAVTGAMQSNAPTRGQDTNAVVRECGFNEHDIAELTRAAAAE